MIARRSPRSRLVLRFAFCGLLMVQESLSATAAQTPIQAVIVVRHGEKATTPHENPPLSQAGAARANALLDALRDAGLTTITTTDQQRTFLLLQALSLPAQASALDDAWLALEARLATRTGATVVAYDRAGFGKSGTGRRLP
jgi:hypothetical protein